METDKSQASPIVISDSCGLGKATKTMKLSYHLISVHQ